MQKTELKTLHYVQKLTQTGHQSKRDLQGKDVGETCA